MSRCFTFPPPGYYEWKRQISEVKEARRIESIKIEQDKAEKERKKEKKREKKEKRKKEKKELFLINGEVEKKRKSNKHEGLKADHKCIEYEKKREPEIEQLERSGLSEEHELPSRVPTLCDSSESTQNSGKRKKRSSPLEGRHNQSTVLRFRLPHVKHKTREELLNKEDPCSSSGGVETTTPKIDDTGPSFSIMQECSISERKEVRAQECIEPAVAVATSAEFSPSRISTLSDKQLRNKLENCVPPSIQMVRTDFDDHDWLFDVPSRHEAKRSKASNVACCFAIPNTWPPRACYLPEAQIYALPYTMPF